MSRYERKLGPEVRKSSENIEKAQNQARLTHVSRQTVYNYIKISKEFILKKRKLHPKWEKIVVYLGGEKTFVMDLRMEYALKFQVRKKFNLITQLAIIAS